MTTLSELKQKLLERPEFRQEYEKAEAEFQLIEAETRPRPKTEQTPVFNGRDPKTK